MRALHYRWLAQDKLMARAERGELTEDELTEIEVSRAERLPPGSLRAIRMAIWFARLARPCRLACCAATMHVELIGHFKPCTTDIYLPI